jgi:intergrase/recombinase
MKSPLVEDRYSLPESDFINHVTAIGGCRLRRLNRLLRRLLKSCHFESICRPAIIFRRQAKADFWRDATALRNDQGERICEMAIHKYV